MVRPTSLGGLGKREKTLEVERSLHGQSHVSLGSGVAKPAGGGVGGAWREAGSCALGAVRRMWFGGGQVVTPELQEK